MKVKNINGNLISFDPRGCGEQNMLRFAPSVYVVDYLTKTGSLTPEVEKNAREKIQQGYQREKKFRQKSGGYAAFEDRTGFD